MNMFIRKTSFWAALILCLGIFLVFYLPRWLTQFSNKSYALDFSKTGQIGDTIGGITAPIIGLVSAILVYFAFREQVQANKIITDRFKTQDKIDQRNLNAQRVSHYFEFIEKTINDFHGEIRYIGPPTKDGGSQSLLKTHELSGQQGFIEYLQRLFNGNFSQEDDYLHLAIDSHEREIKMVCKVMSMFKHYVDLTSKLDLEQGHIDHYGRLMLDFYQIFFQYNMDFKKITVCKSCGVQHGVIPKVVAEHYWLLVPNIVSFMNDRWNQEQDKSLI